MEHKYRTTSRVSLDTEPSRCETIVTVNQNPNLKTSNNFELLAKEIQASGLDVRIKQNSIETKFKVGEEIRLREFVIGLEERSLIYSIQEIRSRVGCYGNLLKFPMKNENLGNIIENFEKVVYTFPNQHQPRAHDIIAREEPNYRINFISRRVPDDRGKTQQRIIKKLKKGIFLWEEFEYSSSRTSSFGLDTDPIKCFNDENCTSLSPNKAKNRRFGKFPKFPFKKGKSDTFAISSKEINSFRPRFHTAGHKTNPAQLFSPMRKNYDKVSIPNSDSKALWKNPKPKPGRVVEVRGFDLLKLTLKGLCNLFSNYGNVKSSILIKETESAYLLFTIAEAAQDACLQLDNTPIFNRKISVTFISYFRLD